MFVEGTAPMSKRAFAEAGTILLIQASSAWAGAILLTREIAANRAMRVLIMFGSETIRRINSGAPASFCGAASGLRVAVRFRRLEPVWVCRTTEFRRLWRWSCWLIDKFGQVVMRPSSG